MSKKFSAGDVLKPAIVLLAICLVTSLLLGLTNQVTAPKIEALQAQAEQDSLQLVLPNAASFEEKTQGGIAYRVGLDSAGSAAGYVFTTSDKGYGGEVKILVGVTPDGKVAGVKTLVLNETVGLGMRAQDESFLSQFVGKVFKIGLVKNSPADNEIQALTGATITSTAVTNAVNKALENFNTVTGGADNG